jgi:hypothetical protein
MARDVHRLPIYRSLHLPPLLGGIPIYLFFGMMGVGCLGVFGVFALVGRYAGFLVVGLLGLLWGLLAFVYRQDRVRIPLMLIGWLHPTSRRISSFSPSQLEVVVVREQR